MTWLLCDFGNVLAHPLSAADRARLVSLAGTTEAELLANYWATQIPYDASLTLRRYWTSIVGGTGNVDDLIMHDLAAWMNPKLDVVEAVRRAKSRGYRLALFSNAPDEFASAFATTDWLSDFERIL